MYTPLQSFTPTISYTNKLGLLFYLSWCPGGNLIDTTRGKSGFKIMQVWYFYEDARLTVWCNIINGAISSQKGIILERYPGFIYA